MSDPSQGLFTVECEACKTVFPAENGKCSCGLAKGKLMLDIDKMLGSIYELQTQDKSRQALDIIFDVFWQLHTKFDLMNEILTKADVTKLDETLMVGFMVQTFKYIKQVPAHLDFCNRAEAQLRVVGLTEEEIHEVVDNYRDAGDYWENMKMLGAPEWLTGPKPE